MRTSIVRPIDNDDLIKAICIRADEAWQALLIARAFGGGFEDMAWWVASEFSLSDLLDEAATREIDLSDQATVVHKTPLSESMIVKRARGEITEEEFRRWKKDFIEAKSDN